MERREFLKTAMTVSAAIAFSPALAACGDGAAYESTSTEIRESMAVDAPNDHENYLDFVRQATLAANSHNTQPWLFKIAGDTIEIHLDHSRRLPVVDPDDRGLWISLGCALENMVIAANHAGYFSTVELPASAEGIITVRFETGAEKGSHPLAQAISLRQNMRNLYTGELVRTSDYAALTSIPLEPGVVLLPVVEPGRIKEIAGLISEGTLTQYSDPAFIDELVYWLRFNKKEAMNTRDGLFSACSGNPTAPRLIGKMFLNPKSAAKTAAAEVEKVMSASGMMVLASENDDVTHWINTGRVYERLALTMTNLGIRSAFHNQPIEVPELRPQLQEKIGAKTTLPQLLFRFGVADPMPVSVRRPVEEVII
ncbi:MAG: hypothetical protein HPY85_00400 [Anaerolineae bacterium]|nr:hypothetical protein [Anaerolineae bacterium]